MVDMRKSGFTLIELMIVIAIIATIATIAVPNLLRSRIAGNEAAAIEGLKTLTSVEALWYAQNPTGTPINSYWTYDVSCFHRFYIPGTQTQVAYIDIALAKADAHPAGDNDFVFSYGNGVAPWGSVKREAKSGYWYTTLLREEGGEDYKQIPVGQKNILAAHPSKFAFMAAPDKYGSTGLRSFIVNQAGTIYAAPIDDKNRWYTTCLDCKCMLRIWPSRDPTTYECPTRLKWLAVQ